MVETRSFGEWLRHRRRELDLTQEELARQVGCAPITVRKIEADQMRPSKQMTELLMEQLRVAADERENIIHFARGGELPKSISGTVPRDNLPHPISSFIGREREIGDVKKLIGRSRLVTLTGAGGCGKSRLAIQATSQMLDLFPDGVWFVAFAPVSDSTLVHQTIVSALRVREDPGRSLIETLCAYFASKHLLLVFDNCEHLIGECAQAADVLLRACPQLRILATSREALGIVGEEQYHVPSLSLPQAAETASPSQLMKSEAVHLFVDRAMLVQPIFSLTTENSSPIAEICRRLDGMPLAIELAAARVKLLTVEHIAEHLDDRFNLLTSGNRTALPRQQTLLATIEWSHELLTESTRILFRRLSGFTGGFTQDAAQAVCSDGGLAVGEVLAELSRLVDQSLLEVVQAGQVERYRMLETIRQYARDRLKESREEGRVRDQHLGYFMGWTEEAEPKLRGPEQITWWDRIETEHDNILAALEWSLSGGNVEAGLRLAASAFWFWVNRGYNKEGLRWLQPLLAKTGPELRTRWRAKALLGIGRLLIERGDNIAVKAALQEALGIWRELGDCWWISLTLVESGHQSLYQGDVETALILFKEAVDVANGVEDKWILAVALIGLGAALMKRSDYSAAQPVLEESIAILRRIGDKVELAESLQYIGLVAYCQKDYERAAMFSEEGLALLRQAGDKSDISDQLILLGNTLQRQGDNVKAARLLRESLSLAQEVGTFVEIAMSLVGLGGVAGGQNESERAARLLGAAVSILKEIGLDMSAWPSDLVDYNDWTAAARAQLGEEIFAAAFADGRAMTLEQAVKYALEETWDV